ncbi:MAG: TldD/PmbA family protein [Opitutaceae bacterium]|nr:TldD/PmbA family protein [Opitutaceae bacterium]
MTSPMHDLASRALDLAKAAGASACRAHVSRDRSVEISYRAHKPETIKEASTLDLNLALFVDDRFSTQHTSDLRPEVLATFVNQAVAMTRLLAEDPLRTLPDPKFYAGRATLDLAQADPAYAALTPDDRHAAVRAAEEACLARGGDTVISATASVSDERYETVTLASNGFEGANEGTVFNLSAELTVHDEGERRANGYWYASSHQRGGIPRPEEIGTRAADETLRLTRAKKIKTETLPIIIENWQAARALGGLMAAFNGRNIQQKQSFLADKRGARFASDKLTLIDDPLLVGGLGSRLFDGEGLAAKRRVMVEAGVLREFFIDWYYSRKLGVEPTTGGASNLIVAPGTRSVAEIMRDLGRGVVVNGFIGGNSNSTTGDFSIGITGALFDKGEVVQNIAEMNIAGNHLEFWNRLVEVGNDPWPYGSWRTPSLVFDGVVISGA